MATKTQILNDLGLGARVRIKNYSGPPGRIVELRGPLGPNGVNIYRVAIPQNPGTSLVELRANQLELIAATPLKGASPKSKKLRPSKKRFKRRPGSID